MPFSHLRKVDKVWEIAAAGDRAVLVVIGTRIDPLLLGEVLALDRALTRQPLDGLVSTVPAYASLLCTYDPAATNADRLIAAIRALEGTLDAPIPSGSVIDVPTRYDGADLSRVAVATGLTPDAVIDRHAGREYLVYCIGFAPGFTYCGELPEALVVPRLATPRTHVAAGSVGITGRQTGIYAVDSPGGWNLIGRTKMRLFDPMADPPARFKAGDRLRFVPTP